MIYFFGQETQTVVAVEAAQELHGQDIDKLVWLLGNAPRIHAQRLAHAYVGPRKEMITPWSTNAVEITQNMQIAGIRRMEEYHTAAAVADFDPMLQARYDELNQELFHIDKEPEPIQFIDDIAAYNQAEGLALSEEEIHYLDTLAKKLGRRLTDSEVFGFSQVNSEHCRHKIFNGRFIIDGREMPDTLFSLIKRTTREHRNRVVSAYKDNVAFLRGPRIQQFAPVRQDQADFFTLKDIDSVLSLKAETHNFPTTVEPFNGAATGSGGEIRDRLAGGKGSMPLAGTAVYMTAYPRNGEHKHWERTQAPRPWLYQNPEEILIKASNGASDFGNKYGQPLINGSLLTFEQAEADKNYGYDKVIMLAGGIGYGKQSDAEKETPARGERIIVLGGDNYRIGMGGGAVSSVDTGEFENAIELNAVQRANPEMQKRVANAIRAMAEMDDNPIISVHDHGAGGHLNSLSELVEGIGGKIDLRKLPIGDPTLSAKEIIGNESQERMGLLLKPGNLEQLRKIAERERAPLYDVGETTGDFRFTFADNTSEVNPMDLELADMFGNPPQTVLKDTTLPAPFNELQYDTTRFEEYLRQVLQIEAVACKDWLTNKVDRSVTGKVACQQTTGEVQLPLSNLGATALDYTGTSGLATAIGHAPVVALADAAAGSRMSIAEALTNIVWAPLNGGLEAVSLSANWMWPAKNAGENARLYQAVQAVSDFAVALGINIPTGKDSLSMTQKYPDGKVVYAPGTVIISAAAEVTDVTKIVTPDLQPVAGSQVLYIPFSQAPFALGGSSFAQILNQVGTTPADVSSAEYFKKAFNAVQALVHRGLVLAGHDISSGGLITGLLEMLFPMTNTGLRADIRPLETRGNGFDVLMAENPGVLIQVQNTAIAAEVLSEQGAAVYAIGEVLTERRFTLTTSQQQLSLDIDSLRDDWFRSSYLLDKNQSTPKLAAQRFAHYKTQPLQFAFPADFTGRLADSGADPQRRKASGVTAAIIREKGVNGDREMAYSLYLAGFDVKDIHMTDLISGREDLSDVQLIVFVGGFSNSDVLGSAKGWAGAFLYNPKAKQALDNFYARPDTLSLGVCNGCQLMVELNLIHPEDTKKPRMLHNDSGKFESAFVNVAIQPSPAIMLQGMEHSRLGIWIAHGEGHFDLPQEETHYHIPMKYSYEEYPGNPNGSDYGAAAICSADGRHLAMMPHLERSLFPWNWAHYPQERKTDELTPWVGAFVQARKWLQEK